MLEAPDGKRIAPRLQGFEGRRVAKIETILETIELKNKLTIMLLIKLGR